jgi:hypothetical protein
MKQINLEDYKENIIQGLQYYLANAMMFGHYDLIKDIPIKINKEAIDKMTGIDYIKFNKYISPYGGYLTLEII